MTIALQDARPGMCIEGPQHRGYIVHIKKTGRLDSMFGADPCIEMFSADDYHTGRCWSRYNPEERVTIIRGEQRKAMMRKLLSSTRKRVYDAEEDIRLLEALESFDEHK